jgi:predicted ATPase
VVTFFVHDIERQDLDIKNALLEMSCFGAAVDKSTLAIIETKLNMTRIDALEAAAAEGLVKNDGTFYTFAHDRIQEAAYGMIEDTEKPLYHKKFGLALIALSLETGNLAMLFVSVNQINLSGPSLWSTEERVEVSKYNLIAGKRSMELSDFSTAFRYFDEGMTYLPKHPLRGVS